MRRALVALLLVAAACTPGEPAAAACPSEVPDRPTATDEIVGSFDGTEIAISVFRPPGVCAEHPVPVILESHGWSGRRASSALFENLANPSPKTRHLLDLLDRGYGVVGIDARGHGDSGGETIILHPDREVRDYQAVLDHVAEIEWVRTDGDGDPRAGSLGGSYGGAFQLMAAAHDDRLDAIVPAVTWHDLPQSLVPNGVVKSFVVGSLFSSGQERVRLDPQLGEWMDRTTDGPPPSDAIESLSASSPSETIDGIDEPTMLVQGLRDVLFPLNQAVDTFRAIDEAWLIAFDGRHEVPFTGQADDPIVELMDACADVFDDASPALTFLDAFVREDPDARERLEALPRVIVQLEGDGCVTGDSWPLGEVETTDGGEVTVTPGQLTDVPLLSGPATVAGIPTLRASAPADDEPVFASVIVRRAGGDEHIVNDQITPFRTSGGIEVDLFGVAVRLAEGDELLLRLEGSNGLYSGTLSQPVTLTGLEVDVPVVR